MVVHGIDELIKKDIPLYYRNEYEGMGDLEYLGERHRVPVAFSVEIKPDGERIVAVRVKEKLDYPLLPIVRALKETIFSMEKDGRLR